jgi:hypothetical protein
VKQGKESSWGDGEKAASQSEELHRYISTTKIIRKLHFVFVFPLSNGKHVIVMKAQF